MSSDPSGIPGDLPPDVLGRIPLFAELQKVLSWSGGPVNWDLAKQIAVAAAASAEAVHHVDDTAASELAEDARVAQMWLAQATPLATAASIAPVRAFTPAQWAEHACTAYRELVDPIAAKVSGAIAEQAPGALPEGTLPPGFDASMLGQAVRQMAPLLLGVQTGGVIGGVAKDLLGEHDLPLPTDDAGAVAVLLPNVDRLAADYALDVRETRLWVTLHETAHRSIFETLPAVRQRFWSLYHDYVASLTVDVAGMMDRLGAIDLSDPARMEEAAGDGGLFAMFDTPSAGEAPARLEHLIGLVESFGDRAVEAASSGRLPSAARIAEAVARHQAGADGRAAIRRFIGIGGGEETRRRAAVFTRAVLDRGGWDSLAAMWDDSQTIPAPDEMEDVEAWMRRTKR